MKVTLTFLTILVSSLCFSQSNSGLILDEETKKGISFARIYFTKSKKGLVCDFDGRFQLDQNNGSTDSCIISCIGYKDKVLSGSDLIKIDTILLAPSNRQLVEVPVIPKKRKIGFTKTGVDSKPKTMFFDNYLTGKTGDIKALWMANERSIEGYIQSINVFITDFGFPSAYFRLHLYAASPMHKFPQEELLSENIIASGGLGNDWVTIDVSHLHIPIGENGFFVGIEWFSAETETEFNDTIGYKIKTYDTLSGKYTPTIYRKSYSGNGCVLGTISEKYRHSKNRFWKLENDEWVPNDLTLEDRFYIPDTFASGTIFIPTEDNCYTFLPCINADIKYFKDKNKTAYKNPKKRKINRIDRIDRIKKNEFKYPQTSVLALFESILKAFEEKEDVYVLRYLCVYKEDELNDILQDLEPEKSSPILLTEETRAEIVPHLKVVISKLEDGELKDLGNGEYELVIDDQSYILLFQKGIWRVNPYTYRVVL